jgi:molybdate transport system regulatory protein
MKIKSKRAGSLSLLPRFRVMQGREIAFGPGKMELLELVGETGSIGKAARCMKMSYMRAWSLIKTMNACCKQPIVEAVRGGHTRGGAVLTEDGRRMLQLYRQMEADSLKAGQGDWRVLQKLLRTK